MSTSMQENIPSGVSFPVKLQDGKLLKAVGLVKLAMSIKLYAFGIYADDEKLKELNMKSKMNGKAPSKPTKEMYQMMIDSDLGMTVRSVIVASGFSMTMVRNYFQEGLGAAIKKLTDAKNKELPEKIMDKASDAIKLTPGSVIEISRLPGYVQFVTSENIVSRVESELLCRAYVYMYLGEDASIKEAKEKFGASMLSMF
ncbi:unnamed protein product [Withania somnifera]